MNCVSCDINVTTFGLCTFPLGIPQLQSDWNLSCDRGLDYASLCENNNNNSNNYNYNYNYNNNMIYIYSLRSIL